MQTNTNTPTTADTPHAARHATSPGRLEPGSAAADRHRRLIDRVLRKRSFAVVSTVSSAGRPHAAGVVYDTLGDDLVVHTMRSSRKARNVASNGVAAVVVSKRVLPVGPPFTVQFQAEAEVLPMDHADVTAALDRGRLGRITGHGELDEPDGCFLRIRPRRTIHTFGFGVPFLELMRDPITNGPRSIDLGGQE